MLHYELTKEQYNEISALAYWIADLYYIRERYGNTEPETETARKTIEFIFTQLDTLQVPFWVQNTVICFSENWRNYVDRYLSDFLKSKNIFREV